MTKKFTAKTLLELKQRIYDEHGWIRVPGESMSSRITQRYDIAIDYVRRVFVATPTNS